MKIFIAFIISIMFAAHAFAQEQNNLSRQPVVASSYEEDQPIVSRHSFTSGISDREPVDTLKSYIISDNNTDTIYYFTEITGMQDKAVKHIWYKNNEIVYERKIDIKGPRWRYPTSMKTSHFKSGDIIRVDVVGSDGIIYSSDILSVE